MRTSLAAVFIGVFLLGAACAQSSTESAPEPGSVGNAEHGEEIFRTGADLIPRACIICHSLERTSEAGSELDGERVGPTLFGISARAGDTVPGLAADEYIRQSILDPQAYVVEGFPVQMPGAYPYLLSDDAVDDLVAFLLTQ